MLDYLLAFIAFCAFEFAFGCFMGGLLKRSAA